MKGRIPFFLSMYSCCTPSTSSLSRLCGTGEDLRGVGEVVSEVVAEGVREVLAETLDGLRARGDGLHGEAGKGNLRGAKEGGEGQSGCRARG